MTTLQSAYFLSGICAATFFGCAVYFLKFWRSSRDAFFAYFSIACVLIALERVMTLFVAGTMVSVASPESEANSWVYLFRFGAFVLISIAILDKNRKSS